MTLPYPGQRFGFLTVLREHREVGCQKTWLCMCDCGNETKAGTSYLKLGRKRSCGCMRGSLITASKTQHGKTGTAEYQVWKGMIKRCENPNSKDYEEYHGRGIVVCSEWRNSFQAFFDHVGLRPSPQHSIDRINNDLGYQPGNIRWATPKQQSNNRRHRRWAKKP